MNKIILYNEDFNDFDTGKQYDVIIMNPPFVKFGEKFIKKCISLLKPGGYFGCIMSPTWRSVSSKTGRQYNKSYTIMVQAGEFIMIHMYSTKETKDAFGQSIGQVDTFVWRKND